MYGEHDAGFCGTRFGGMHFGETRYGYGGSRYGCANGGSRYGYANDGSRYGCANGGSRYGYANGGLGCDEGYANGGLPSWRLIHDEYIGYKPLTVSMCETAFFYLSKIKKMKYFLF